MKLRSITDYNNGKSISFHRTLDNAAHLFRFNVDTWQIIIAAGGIMEICLSYPVMR